MSTLMVSWTFATVNLAYYSFNPKIYTDFKIIPRNTKRKCTQYTSETKNVLSNFVLHVKNFINYVL